MVNEEKAGDVFQDPRRIFNFDESYFLLAKKRGTVFGPADYKNFLQVSKENDKEGHIRTTSHMMLYKPWEVWILIGVWVNLRVVG